MIKNVIFDLGNVLLDFNPKGYLKKKINEINIDDVYEAIFKSEEWPMLDRGTITEDDAKRNIINRNKSYEEDIVKAFNNWYELLIPIAETVEVLGELKKKGYKVYYLSNFHSAAFDYVTSHHDFFDIFDGGVVSYAEKLLKPEKEIYMKIIKRYDLIPEESVFIDDTLENVKGAEACGIKGIYLYNTNKLKEKLRNMDINI